MKEKCKYKVTKRGSSSKSIMAYTPQDAIARLCQVSPVFIEQSDINNATYCVERLDSTRKSVRYYNINTPSTTTNKVSTNDIVDEIRKWFDLKIDNWYNEHTLEGDEEGSDYLYMDGYESDVTSKNATTLAFYGHCSGHYEDETDCDFNFDIVEMTKLLDDCDIKVGSDVVLSRKQNEIILTLKKLTLEQFAAKLE